MSEPVNISLPERRSGPARPAEDAAPRPRLPAWFRVPLPGGDGYRQLKSLTKELSLHTVCEEASCLLTAKPIRVGRFPIFKS